MKYSISTCVNCAPNRIFACKICYGRWKRLPCTFCVQHAFLLAKYALHREHFIKCPSVTGRGLWCVPVGTHLQWGIVPATEAEIGLSPAYSCFLALVAKNTLPLFVVYRPHEAGVLGHLIKIRGWRFAAIRFRYLFVGKPTLIIADTNRLTMLFYHRKTLNNDGISSIGKYYRLKLCKPPPYNIGVGSWFPFGMGYVCYKNLWALNWVHPMSRKEKKWKS